MRVSKLTVEKGVSVCGMVNSGACSCTPFDLRRTTETTASPTIAKAATVRHPEARYTVTLPAHVTPLAKRLIPEKLLDRMQLQVIRRMGGPLPHR